MNGLALLQGFEDTGDKEMLVKGYAGAMSVMHNVLADGMGFAWFILKPGVFACEPRKTFEFGPALWGFLKAGKSYVLTDELFGLVGFGCDIETSDSKIKVYPKDGIKKRLRLVSEKIDVEVTIGEIKALALDRAENALELQLTDSTGLVRTAQATIQGLPQGDYRISHGSSTERVSVSDKLRLAVPIAEPATLTVQKL